MVSARIPIGVEVESRPSGSRWVDRVWRAVALRPGARGIADWTILDAQDGVTRYYAGTARLVLHAADTARYRDNITSRTPSVYVVLRRTRTSPTGWSLYLASVDPSEAQAHSEFGDDLVEALPMPQGLLDWTTAFVARHHVERPTWKRERDAKTPRREGPPRPPADADDGFLDRWSRRKRSAAAPPPGPETEPGVPEGPPVAPLPAAEDAADLSRLDTLHTRADYASLLRETLPKALRLAALRQAWRSDAAITGHRPLVDYDWNFNAPGYGRPLPTDDPARLVDALFGHLRRAAAAPEREPDQVPEQDRDPPDGSEMPVKTSDCRPEPSPAEEAPGPKASEAAPTEPLPRRRHGGAIPT